MRGITFNDGLSEVIGGNGELKTFTKNLPKSDRLTALFKAEREMLNDTPIPVTSTPAPAIALSQKVAALKANTNATLKALKMEYLAEVANAKMARDTRVKAGMDPARANAEFKLASETALANARAKAAQIKTNALAQKKDLTRQIMESSMEYVRDLKTKYQLAIQNKEKAIVETLDLYKSGKISKESADAVIASKQKEIAAYAKEMKALLYKGQISAIDTSVKLGMMSSFAAEQLKKDKVDQWKEMVAKMPKNINLPEVSYNVIDKETGREVSRGDLERHLQFMRQKNASPEELNKLKTVLDNLRRPGSMKRITIKMTMNPNARKLNIPGGERVYSVTESKRIDVHSDSVPIPVNSIAGDEPSTSYANIQPEQITNNALLSLSSVVKNLSNDFKALYQQATTLGKAQDVRVLMLVDSISGLQSEISNGAQTGRDKEDIYGLMERLKDTYKSAIVELKKVLGA